MSMVKKSISLTDKQAQWLKGQIAGGAYGNESEILRDLIRERQERDEQIEAIRAALIAAEQSGVSDATPEQIRDRVQERLTKRGALSTK